MQLYSGGTKGKPEENLAIRVVKDLVSLFEFKGYHLYTDNFYTCATLSKILHEKGIYGCCTTRTNRWGFPTDIISQNFRTVPRGTSDWRMAGAILAQAWADSKPVYLLSTTHDPEYPENFTGKQTVLRRRKGKGESLAVPAPLPPPSRLQQAHGGD